MSHNPRISVIIVNYNVKDYLEQALISLKRALMNISHEIFVVDNASIDGSVSHVRQRFPEVTLIESEKNVGFGQANNIALKQARGEFMVLINPDTVVQEDTFEKLLQFFETYADAGAATCKIINPDGSFAIDCRHSIPTPAIALWKVLGLSKIFPRSKIFAQYNLTYLNPDDTYPVPAISGSFMMIKKQVLDKVGHFDERFFMYCEDIDLCHRINLEGYKIYYVPTSQIIHYKGESTKKNNIDYVITFNKALYQFFKKYHAKKTLFLFRWLIVLGIIVRGVFVYLRNFLYEHFPVIVDTLILNGVVILAFYLRLELKDGFSWHNYFQEPWIINVLSTVMFWGSANYLGVYPHHRFSIQGIIKANILTFTLLASLTFFLKQFAYSRLVVIGTAFASPFFMILWRGILKRYYRGDKSAWGKDIFSKPTVIVGNGSGAVTLFQKIREMKDMTYDLLGVVTVGENETEFEKDHIPVLGRIENLEQLIAMHRVRQIIFYSEMLSYEKILRTMSEIGEPQLEYKIAPSNLEVVIGKSSIERLDDYPFLEIEYAIGKPFNRVTKRAFDIVLSALMFFLCSPVMLPLFVARLKHKKSIRILGAKGEPVSIMQVKSLQPKNVLNYWLLWWEVLRGNLSFVGAPIQEAPGDPEPGAYWYKPGITGLVQINRKKIITTDDMEKYHLFYLKNQSILLDVEILLKSIFLRG